MTQALLNNLNILQDSNLSLKDKVADDKLVNFAKILQDKTPKIHNNTDDTNEYSTNSANINIESVNNTTNSIDSETCEKEVCTIGDLKKSTQYNLDDLKEAINEAIIENEILELTSPVLAEEIEENKENCIDKTIVPNNKEENTEEDNSDTLPTTQENTITTEETTMTNDELIYQPLESPTTAMLLQSQLPKHSFKDNQNTNDESSESNNTTLKTNELTKNLKNYDAQNNEKTTASINVNEKDISSEKAGHKLSNIVDKKVIEDLNIETVEAESTQNESNGNLLNNQSPQEQAVKAIMRIDGTTNSKIEFVSATQNNKVPTEASTSKVIEQISKQIETMNNGSKVNIVLNPENLGKVSLQILSLKEGLSAQFTVTNQETQNILMKGLAGLKESLLAHGINVDNVTVKLQETGDNEHHYDWTEQEGSRGGNKQQNPHKQKENEKQFEQMMFEFNENGNV